MAFVISSSARKEMEGWEDSIIFSRSSSYLLAKLEPELSVFFWWNSKVLSGDVILPASAFSSSDAGEGWADWSPFLQADNSQRGLCEVPPRGLLRNADVPAPPRVPEYWSASLRFARSGVRPRAGYCYHKGSPEAPTLQTEGENCYLSQMHVNGSGRLKLSCGYRCVPNILSLH